VGSLRAAMCPEVAKPYIAKLRSSRGASQQKKRGARVKLSRAAMSADLHVRRYARDYCPGCAADRDAKRKVGRGAADPEDFI
jgi:hypothetical protein